MVRYDRKFLLRHPLTALMGFYTYNYPRRIRQCPTNKYPFLLRTQNVSV